MDDRRRKPLLDVRGRPPEIAAIAPGLFVGEYPRAQDVGRLRTDWAVSAVLSLQDDDDLAAKGIDPKELVEAYRRGGITLRHLPVADNDPAALAEALPVILDALDALFREGHTVLVHCNAGFNRSPTVAIAYLHRCRSMPLEAACELVKKKRPCVPFITVLERAFGPPRAEKG
ncbi:MAG: dual specificity protein phosphatase family protein [Candidatus Binatia bacterium]